MFEAPIYWKTTLEDVEETLKIVKKGTVTQIATSAGGRPIYQVEYGKSNVKFGTANCSSALGAHNINYFADKTGEDYIPTVYLGGCIHGGEFEGTMAILNLIKLIETGDGSNRQSNLINEFIYSVALDNGFKVSTTCSSDSHGPVWGYHRFPGKTVIMAKERSKEAFLDAICNNRIYGCESGNLKVRYSVNGRTAPVTLTPSDKSSFKVEISYFSEDESTVPVKCQLISDYGKIVKVIEGVDFTSFSFDVEAPDAGYFFLRFVDSKFRRTWSVPVWTGAPLKGTKPSSLTALGKAGFTVTEVKSGERADVIVNDLPTEPYVAGSSSPEFIIDMNRSEKISALGHYPRVIRRSLIKDWYGGTPPIIAEFPAEFEIFASKDGEHYEKCAEGIFRTFGSEEIIEFPERDARFVKLKILSNVGAFKGGEFENADTAIGELTLFSKSK